MNNNQNNNNSDFDNYFSRRKGNSKTPSSYCFNPITGKPMNK